MNSQTAPNYACAVASHPNQTSSPLSALLALSPEEADRLGVAEPGVPGHAGGESDLVHLPRGSPQLGHVREPDHARLREADAGAQVGAGVLSL